MEIVGKNGKITLQLVEPKSYPVLIVFILTDDLVIFFI